MVESHDGHEQTAMEVQSERPGGFTLRRRREGTVAVGVGVGVYISVAAVGCMWWCMVASDG